MNAGDVRTLACHVCRGELSFHGQSNADGSIDRGHLRCGPCNRRWRVRDGLPYLYEEKEVRGVDRLMRFVYDYFGALHEPGVRYLLPLLQLEGVSRDPYMRRLELHRLPKARRVRILEVGVGDGANLPLIDRALPKGIDVEIWGLDLSRGMIDLCRRRLGRRPDPRVRLLLADAHALPFPNASFDRVFHIGGIGGYRDPRRGLAEMARVARPGTPIVVVDERLDPNRAHGAYQRLMFRAITLYNSAPAAPIAELPAGALDVIDEQATRFYYCLTFRTPRPSRRAVRPRIKTAS